MKFSEVFVKYNIKIVSLNLQTDTTLRKTLFYFYSFKYKFVPKIYTKYNTVGFPEKFQFWVRLATV
jgi:hypothetical protein